LSSKFQDIKRAWALIKFKENFIQPRIISFTIEKH